MDIWEIDKLILFLVFFIPGFISLKVYDLFIAGPRRDFSAAVLEAIGYSALNFAALSWLIVAMHSGGFQAQHRNLYFLAVFAVLFVFPLVWPLVFLRLARVGPIARRGYLSGRVSGHLLFERAVAEGPLTAKSRPSSKEFICSVRPSLNVRFRL